jgi:hypothetical protein
MGGGVLCKHWRALPAISSVAVVALVTVKKSTMRSDAAEELLLLRLQEDRRRRQLGENLHVGIVTEGNGGETKCGREYLGNAMSQRCVFVDNLDSDLRRGSQTWSRIIISLMAACHCNGCTMQDHHRDTPLRRTLAYSQWPVAETNCNTNCMIPEVTVLTSLVRLIVELRSEVSDPIVECGFHRSFWHTTVAVKSVASVGWH